MAKYRLRRPKPLPYLNAQTRLIESRYPGCRRYRRPRRRTRFLAWPGQLARLLAWRCQVRRCGQLGVHRIGYATWRNPQDEILYFYYRGGKPLMISDVAAYPDGEDVDTVVSDAEAAQAAPAAEPAWEPDDATRDNLRARALAEYQRVEEERAVEEAKATHKAELCALGELIKDAERLLGITGGRPYLSDQESSFVGNRRIRRPMLEHDGLELFQYSGTAHRFRLVTYCPCCQQTTYSSGFTSLYDLGELLAEAWENGAPDRFTPDRSHRCIGSNKPLVVSTPPPSPADDIPF